MPWLFQSKLKLKVGVEPLLLIYILGVTGKTANDK